MNETVTINNTVYVVTMEDEDGIQVIDVFRDYEAAGKEADAQTTNWSTGTVHKQILK